MEKRLHDFLPYIKDYYTVNEFGEFFSDNSGKMKTRNKAGSDYQIINFMTVDNNKMTFRAHRLVLMAFNPIKNMDLMEVNHIDGNKENNNLSNLEWCTPSENQIHAFKLGLQKPREGEKSNLSKLTHKDIEKIFKMREKGYTQQRIAEEVGCSRANVCNILNGKTWKSSRFNDYRASE